MSKTAQKTALKVWLCTDHAVHYPAQPVSIAVAPTEDEARDLILAALRERGLVDEPFTVREMPVKPGAYVLSDGN